MNIITFRDVALTLGSRPVLAGVSLEILAGEFVGMLGPNGAGKTTLMRAVLGLISPSRGEVRVFGRPATRGNPAIGYMPQVHGGISATWLRGRDFVASAVDGHRLGLPLHGGKARGEVDRVLGLVGAEDLAGRPLGALSGGERRRLLLAQALLRRPQVLLLDEPLISLDPNRQREVVDLVKSLQVELGITVLFSAHELNPLLPAIDRVLYLGSGQAALGTVDQVITGPVLSRLYGSTIKVVRLDGAIFVMSAGHHIERDDHRHQHPEQAHSGHA